MSTVSKVIGYAFLVAWLSGALGLIDMVVCIGSVGACTQTHAAKKVITT